MEKEDYSGENDRSLRLSMEQQAEIGDILLSARAVSRQMVNQAREQSEEILANAEKEAGRIMREAEEKAAAILSEAERRAAAPVLSPEMQEYVVRCAEACFTRLRRQQLETLDLINEQWRSFLSQLPTGDERQGADQASAAIRPEDIENRVSAIAREIVDLSGN